MILQEEYNLNLESQLSKKYVKVSQYDTGRRLLITLIKNDCSMFKIPSEASASINGLKPDGKGFRYDCSIENNKVVVDMKEQMTVLAGYVKCEILLSKGGERIATANFMLSVEESPLSENTQISSTDIPLLQKAIEASEIVLSVEKTVKGYSESASKSSQSAQKSAESASNASASSAESARNSSQSAQASAESANNASQSATNAKQSETNASNSAKEAQKSAESAIQTKAEVEQLKKETVEQTKTLTDSAKQEISTVKDATVTEVTELKNSTVSKITSLKDSTIEAVTLLKDNAKAEADRATESSTSAKVQAEKAKASADSIANVTSDVEKLKEDLPNKITKFYASNQGETHITDSDNGKIQDMMIYGKSNQNQTKGKNLLKYPYIETTKLSNGITFTDNKDGSINISGTGTETAYYNLYSNSDGKRLTLASGTYKLVAKGRSKCNVFINNGVNSAKNEGTFTITDGHNDVWCFIEAPKGLEINETIYPMIQLSSSTDESYEPYTGGNPSPNPDYPQEIKSVVNPTVKVTNEDGLKVQSVTLDNITLNAIPVSNGGNVTIDGKQYIADYVDVERGKLYRKVNRLNLKDVDATKISHGFHANGNGYLSITAEKPLKNQKPISNKYIGEVFSNKSGYVYIPNNINIILVDERFTDKQTAIKLSQDTYVIYVLSSPTEEDLPLEQIKFLKSLSANYPVTNISVNSEQLDGYTVFNYPISMANGWNYVKQQLNDNRDYIYDMDLQSAEAYVNSEYALTLTELEV